MACNAKPRHDFTFDVQDLSQKQVARAEAECNFEAEKAAMRAKNSVTAGDNWEKIFVLCMQAKGARYIRATPKAL